MVDIAAQSTTAGSTTLAVHGLAQAQHVKKAVFSTTHHGARAAYDATVTTGTDGDLASYQVVVDAQTGDLLYRQSQVDYLVDDPTWLAPRHSMAYNDLNAFPWNYPTTDNREAPLLDRDRGLRRGRGRQPGDDRLHDGRRLEVPVGRPARLGGSPTTARRRRSATTSTTRGCGAGDHGVYGNPALVRDTSATRDYQPAFTDAWYTSGCDPNNVNAATNPLGNDIEASTVSLFVGHNVMHDWAYYLGFDEGHWNAQQYNNDVTTVDPSPPPGGPTSPRRSATTG